MLTSSWQAFSASSLCTAPASKLIIAKIKVAREREMWAERATPFMGMVMAELAQVGLMIISKVAMSSGMSDLVFICYSNALASILLLSIILCIYRSEHRPPLNVSLLGGFFLLGLIGFGCQISGYSGIYYSSPTLATALLNLVPGLTFVLAIIFRMERLDWRSSTFTAKSIGTIVSIGGALIVTLYQGPPILAKASHVGTYDRNLHFTQEANWVIGGLLLMIDCVMTSSWVILQAVVLKRYPAEVIVVFFYCLFVAFQSAIVILLKEGDLGVWSLKSKVRLMSILYSGVFGSAFQVVVCSWCLKRKGPVFVSMFKPLGVAIAVGVGVIFSGDTFYLGSLIGIVLIVVGFYSVMWGKVKEEKIDEIGEMSSPIFPDQNSPLLPNWGGQK